MSADTRSPAERRLAEARTRIWHAADEVWSDGADAEVFAGALDALIESARAAERERLLAGQYDADVDPGR